MKTLINLQAEAVETDYRGGQSYEHSVAELDGGQARVARLGLAGLTITNGTAEVAIPLGELFRLAERVEPALVLQRNG